MHPSRIAATFLTAVALGRVPGVRVGQLPRLWVNGDGGELAVTVGACCALWQEYKAVFYECSAVTGYNIMEPMLHMARSVNSSSLWDTSPAGGDWCGLSWAMDKKRGVSETGFLSPDSRSPGAWRAPSVDWTLCTESFTW